MSTHMERRSGHERIGVINEKARHAALLATGKTWRTSTLWCRAKKPLIVARRGCMWHRDAVRRLRRAPSRKAYSSPVSRFLMLPACRFAPYKRVSPDLSRYGSHGLNRLRKRAPRPKPRASEDDHRILERARVRFRPAIENCAPRLVHDVNWPHPDSIRRAGKRLSTPKLFAPSVVSRRFAKGARHGCWSRLAANCPIA